MVKTLDFNLDSWIIGYSGWMLNTNNRCPYCSKFHSHSFVPEELIKDKVEYVTKCELCGKNVIVRMSSKEFINVLIDEIHDHLDDIERSVEAQKRGIEDLDKYKILDAWM